MCVGVYIYIYTHTHTCMGAHTYVCIHIYAYIQLIVSRYKKKPFYLEEVIIMADDV